MLTYLSSSLSLLFGLFIVKAFYFRHWEIFTQTHHVKTSHCNPSKISTRAILTYIYIYKYIHVKIYVYKACQLTRIKMPSIKVYYLGQIFPSFNFEGNIWKFRRLIAETLVGPDGNSTPVGRAAVREAGASWHHGT